eukprot:TRINITY_DN78065_c0_g1_i1.p1 TRINITY_DN78065_c0_g1~~TRINITY_DN78065_c0_g1_i1.p1  ORF type:complete len:576 (-),score=118.78 TRINITY_DN78065_c0_g1_i1:41-1744(-)
MALPPPKLKGVIQLARGTKVQVTGLQGSKELNGLIGHLLEFDAAKMRWGVELEGGKRVLLKISNLIPLNSEISAATVDEQTGAPKPMDTGASYPSAATNELDKVTPQESEVSVVASKENACVGAIEGNDESWPVLPTSTDTAKKMQSGCWFDGGSAARRFTEQLRVNDPTLHSVVLVPPKRFNDEDAKEIAESFEGNTFCKELIASGHSLSLESCERLAQMLRKTESLQLFSVGDSTLGDEASILFRALAENSSVTSIDLEKKGLTLSACSSLAEALRARNCKRLASLRLSSNRGIGDALAELAEKAPAPLQLTLCDCALNSRHAKSLGLWVSGGVENLDLRDNSGLGGEGLDNLLTALGTSPVQLTCLNLTGCAIGNDGLEAIAEACRGQLQNLEDLLFERCEVSSEGCRMLSGALAGRRLRKISARANVIGDEGCAVLAYCARSLDLSATSLSGEVLTRLAEQPLQDLELFSNPALGPSVATWCDALKAEQWQQLEYLDLSGCCLKDEGFRCICFKLKGAPDLMPALKFLCLGSNDVSEDEELAGLVEQLQEARAGKLRVVWQNT